MLLTVDEVIRERVVRNEFDRSLIETAIQEAEEYFEWAEIGTEGYEELFNALVMYTPIEYDNLTAYSIGDTVKFNDFTVYESLANQTGVPPTTENIQLGLWQIAPKFEGGCADAYNELWNKYLRKYLAIRTALLLSVPSTIQLGATGLSKVNADFETAASSEDIKRFDAFNNARARRVFNTMVLFTRKSGNSCYSKFLFTRHDKMLKGKTKRRIRISNIRTGS